jgi:hypothetical protein
LIGIRVLGVSLTLAAAGCLSAGPAPIVIAIGARSTVRVGDTVKVAVPSSQVQWTAAFDESKLRPLTGNGETSPPDGWTWKALQSGHTEIVLTGKPAPCPAPPCGPNVPQLVVVVDIVKS